MRNPNVPEIADTSPEVLLVSDRLDLPVSAPRVVKLRARLILRSLEVCVDGVTPETTYHLACPNSLLTPFFTVRIPSEFLNDGDHAVLFEVLPVDSEPIPITWVVFPLVGISEREYRIQFSSTRPRIRGDILAFLREGKFRILRFPGFIKFRLRAALSEDQHKTGDTGRISATGEAIAKLAPEARFNIFAEVSPPENRGSPSLIKWSPQQTLAVFALGKSLYIYNSITKAYEASLACKELVSALGWIADKIVFCLAAGKSWFWCPISGSSSILEVPHQVVGLLSVSYGTSLILLGIGRLSLLSEALQISEVADPRIQDCLSAIEYEGSFLLITTTRLLEIRKEEAMYSTVDLDTELKVRLAQSRCIVLESGVVTVVEHDLTLRELHRPSMKVTAVSVSPDEKYACVGGETGCIEVIDFNDGSLIYRSECLFPDSVRAIDWSNVHHMLCAIGHAAENETLSALILLASEEMAPYMRPTLYEWTSAWINEEHPGSQHVDIQEMKRDIIRRSMLASSQRS